MGTTLGQHTSLRTSRISRPGEFGAKAKKKKNTVASFAI